MVSPLHAQWVAQERWSGDICLLAIVVWHEVYLRTRNQCLPRGAQARLHHRQEIFLHSTPCLSWSSHTKPSLQHHGRATADGLRINVMQHIHPLQDVHILALLGFDQVQLRTSSSVAPFQKSASTTDVYRARAVPALQRPL